MNENNKLDAFALDEDDLEGVAGGTFIDDIKEVADNVNSAIRGTNLFSSMDKTKKQAAGTIGEIVKDKVMDSMSGDFRPKC